MNTELLSTKLNPPTCVFVAIESHWHISHFLKSYCFCEAFTNIFCTLAPTVKHASFMCVRGH